MKLHLVLLAIVLAACTPVRSAEGDGGPGGGSFTDAGTTTAAQDAGALANDAGGGTVSTFDGGLWSLTPAASPLTVSATLENDAGVAQDFTIAGGVLTATASDGTTFELTIPNDALISPQTIVMTPVRLDANPFGTGKTWGVQLLPDGLTFNSPLTLVITPGAGQTPPVAQQVPFGWGANNQVALAAPAKGDSRLTLQLLHFSSYAYATATQGISASLAGVRNRIGGSAEARIQSAIAERLTAERQRQLLGDEESGMVSIAEVIALLREYVKEVVEVRVAAAGSSCAAGRLALETVLGTERQAQLLGLTGAVPQYAQLEPLVDTVAGVCLDEEYALCRDQHIIQRIIPVWLGLERQSQLLGIDTSNKAWETKAEQHIRACHKYRLDIESTITNDSSEWKVREAMQGQVKLSLTPGDLLSASLMSEAPHGPLISTSYTVNYTDPCSGIGTITPHDATFVVQSLDWSLKTDPRVSGKGEIDKFKLLYFANNYSGSVVGTTHVLLDLCNHPPNPPQTINGLNYWATYVVVLGSLPAYFNDTEGFFFADWVVHNGSAVLATKSVDENFVDADIHLTTTHTMTLNHTPGP